MVARIKAGNSIQGAIRYNEDKVKQQQAALIFAHGFTKDIGQLGLKDKLLRLEKLASLNERVKTNCLHVSLNFHPSENLSINKLQAIAVSYMKGIGFGDQPYLVYQHFDAAHGHVHIVSTNIQKDGQRISLHNMGRGVSEKIRKKIELDFNLVRAVGKHDDLSFPNDDWKRIEYGKMGTKKALSRIVTRVMEQYHFASFAEFNAALRGFGVAAHRGEETSRMYQKGGMVYNLLNTSGERVGIPIKASAIYNKPTLKHLTAKFEKGKEAKKQFQHAMSAQLTSLLGTRIKDLQEMETVLQKNGISMILLSNETGFLYGVTYVNHKDKCVFKGSELGKQFSATALRERFSVDSEIKQTVDGRVKHFQEPKTIQPNPVQERDRRLTEVLTAPGSQLDYIPFAYKRKRKKKNKLKV